jgi:hypothetical protein
MGEWQSYQESEKVIIVVLHDKDYTYAWSKEDALLMARRLHSGARKFSVETIEKANRVGKYPRPGRYLIHSYY